MDEERLGRAGGPPGEKPRITVRYGSARGGAAEVSRPAAGVSQVAAGKSEPRSVARTLTDGLPYALLLQMLLEERDPGRVRAAAGGVPAAGEPGPAPGGGAGGGPGEGSGGGRGGNGGSGRSGDAGGAAPGNGGNAGDAGGQLGGGGRNGRQVSSLEAVIDDVFALSKRLQSTAVYLKAVLTVLSMSPSQFADEGEKAPGVSVEAMKRLISAGQSGKKKDISSLMAMARSPEFMTLAEEFLGRMQESEGGEEKTRGQT